MPTLQLYNTREGHTVLAEYRGAAFDVVLLQPAVQLDRLVRLQDARLALLASTPLRALRNQTGLALLEEVPLSVGQLLRADQNGTVHHLLQETALLSAGMSVVVHATVHRGGD